MRAGSTICAYASDHPACMGGMPLASAMLFACSDRRVRVGMRNDSSEENRLQSWGVAAVMGGKADALVGSS